MKFTIITANAICILIFTGLNTVFSQRLNLFTSESESIINNRVKERVPYKRAVGFYDFIPEGTPHDQILQDSGYYYIYFLLPEVVNEIGIRIISPVPDYVFAHTGDIETDNFEKWYRSDKTSHFDPLIVLEYGLLDREGGFTQVALLGENYHSNEVIPQPSGKMTNALLRLVKTEFPSGLYRIRIASTGKDTPAYGSYLVHLGLVPGLRGIKISRNIEDLFSEE